MSARVATGRALERPDLAPFAGHHYSSLLGRVGAAALLIAGGVHVALGFEHAGSNFGGLAIIAGVSQGALAVALIVRPSRGLLSAIAMLELVLIQLYVINVTIGLPPVIAHSHVGGTHQILGLTLAWPGVIDGQGLIAKAAEALAALAALALRQRVRPS